VLISLPPRDRVEGPIVPNNSTSFSGEPLLDRPSR
jgi:hypothetical protein